jgi:hypothetical protein
MTFMDVLTSLKSDYSPRSAHKALQVLLGEVAIGLVLEEEGTALLVEVHDSSRTDRGQRLRSSKGDAPR